MRRLTPQERGQLVDLRIIRDTGISCCVQPWEVPILNQLKRDGLVDIDRIEKSVGINERGRRALAIDDALATWEQANVTAA